MTRQCEYEEVYDPKSGRYVERHIFKGNLRYDQPLQAFDEDELWKRQQEILNYDGFVGSNQLNELFGVEQDDEYVPPRPNIAEIIRKKNLEYSRMRSANNEPFEETDEETDEETIGETPYYKNLIEKADDEPRFELFDENSDNEEESDDEDVEKEPINGDDDKLADMCFKEEDLQILRSMKLPQPSVIKDDEIDSLLYKVNHWIDYIGKKKRGFAKNKNDKMCDTADTLLTILKIYRDILNPEKDQTGGRYKQNRRNAYKIGAGGKYGDLVIHLPGLMIDRMLEAFKNGKKLLRERLTVTQLIC